MSLVQQLVDDVLTEICMTDFAPSVKGELCDEKAANPVGIHSIVT